MLKYRLNNREYICPLQLALSTLMGKWKGLIVWIILESKVVRFGELKKEINQVVKITDKMLIQSLREMESDGMIKRKVYPVVPPKVEYRLTEAGMRLKPVIDALEEFGELYAVDGKSLE